MRILGGRYQPMQLYIKVGFSSPVQAPFFLICGVIMQARPIARMSCQGLCESENCIFWECESKSYISLKKCYNVIFVLT